MNALTPFSVAGSDRVPPTNIDIEQEILGALIARPEFFAAVQATLLPEHFSEHVHGATYEAIRAAVEAGQTPSLGTIRQHLGAKGFTADIGGDTLGACVGRLVSHYGPATGLAASARMIRDLWALRQIMAVGDDIARDDAGFDPAAKLSDRFGQLDAIRAALLDRERTSATAEQAAGEVVARIEAALQGAEPLPSTGIFRLTDELGGGLHPSNLIVVAARTSMGKSALGLEIADAVTRQGFGCVYHSLEMSAVQVSARQISSRLERAGIRVPYRDIMRGRVAEAHVGAILDIRAHMRGESLWIEEAGGCRFHGGKSTGPKTTQGRQRSRRSNWKHGHYSAEAKAERAQARAALRQLRHWIAALRA